MIWYGIFSFKPLKLKIKVESLLVAADLAAGVVCRAVMVFSELETNW